MTTKNTLQLNDTKVAPMKRITSMEMMQHEEYPNLNNPILLLQFKLNPVSNSESTEKNFL